MLSPSVIQHHDPLTQTYRKRQILFLTFLTQLPLFTEVIVLIWDDEFYGCVTWCNLFVDALGA